MNRTDENEPRLPDEAEQLLERWPIPERDESDWEGLALQIDARIEHTELGSTDDALLMAPLPEGTADEAEPERRSHPRVKRPSDGGLAALAKATMLVRDELQKTELAQATLDVARKARLAPRPRAARAAVAARVAEAPQATSERRSSRTTLISMAFGVVGMAAAIVMYVSTQRAQPSLALTEAPAGALVEKSAPVAPGVGAKVEAAEAVPSMRVEEVPLAEAESSSMVAAAPRRALAKPASAPARAKAEGESSQAERESPAPGPSEAGMVMADGRAGIAERPSPGAIQAAVGSVMGSARACAAGLDGVSRAALTFGSDGRVKSVAVSGPAQGTGAEACIQTALGRARVQPFARASYTVRLSVRPE